MEYLKLQKSQIQLAKHTVTDAIDPIAYFLITSDSDFSNTSSIAL